MLPATLDHRMKLYSTAAAVAGVSMLALAQPAQAKVVYTPANVNVNENAPYALDVNGDGTADFTFTFFSADHTDLLICDLDTVGNALQSYKGERGEAGAFPVGAVIGPAQNFTSATTYGGIFMAAVSQYSVSNSWGPWINVNNRYLGMKFLIDGEVHYGWARFSIRNWDKRGGKVLLTGYAYETDVNKKITAGDEGTETKAAAETQAVPATQSASLGMLAMGAAALPLWRRDDNLAH
jgi:hypothetical protein